MTRQLTLIGLMTAITCILSPWALPLPFSPVPLSLATFAIYLSLWILGGKQGTISVLIYLLLGAMGLPVFSGFAGGIGKLLGPTGGFLLGYLCIALLGGIFIDKYSCKPALSICGLLLGTLVCYALGSLWLSRQLEITWLTALGIGVLPYLPGDIIKLALAAFGGRKIRKRLIAAKLV